MALQYAHVPAAAGIVLPLPLPRPAIGDNWLQADAGRSASLALDQLSTLLWAGMGFRQHGHGRAALPPRPHPLVTLYTVLPEGSYRYDPVEHRLLLVTPEDLRPLIERHGALPAVLHLVYVDGSAVEEEGAWEECGIVAGSNAAHVAQNVAEYCLPAGLVASVARQVSPGLAGALDLVPGQRIELAQKIAWPAAAAH